MPMVLTIIRLIKTALQQARDLNTLDNFTKSDWKDYKIGENLDPSKLMAAGNGLVYEVDTKADGTAKKEGLIGSAVKQVKKETKTGQRMFVVYDDYMVVVVGEEIGRPENEIDCLFSSNDGKDPCHVSDLEIKMGEKNGREACFFVRVNNATRFKRKDSGRLWEFIIPCEPKNEKLIGWLGAHSLGKYDKAAWEKGSDSDDERRRRRQSPGSRSPQPERYDGAPPRSPQAQPYYPTPSAPEGNYGANYGGNPPRSPQNQGYYQPTPSAPEGYGYSPAQNSAYGGAYGNPNPPPFPQGQNGPYGYNYQNQGGNDESDGYRRPPQ